MATPVALPTLSAPDAAVVPVDRSQRLHISMGATCNNNCSFCIEENRLARFESVSRITPQFVRQMLETHPNREEMCFTHGEPTMNPMLSTYIGWARDLGYRRIGLITNGRLFAVMKNAERMLRLGLNHVIVSAHGSDQKRHEALTRTPGSFEQTTAGIRNLGLLARTWPLKLHTNTVITRRNVDDMGPLYAHFAELGVHDVVFSVMKPIGRGNTSFDSHAARYSTVVEEFLRTVNRLPMGGTQVYLEDVPYCVSEKVRDCHRGFVEENLHFFADDDAVYHIAHTGDEESERAHRPECDQCAYRPVCPGVFRRYVAEFGWEEFQPVRREERSAVLSRPDVHAYQMGIKPAALVVTPDSELPALRRRFPALETATRRLQPRAGTAQWEPAPGESGGGFVAAYCSGSPEWSRELKRLDEIVSGGPARAGLSEEAVHAAERRLGLLLGFPRCCVEAYTAMYDEQPALAWNAPVIWRALERSGGGGHFLLNVFAPGVAPLVGHFPCSFRCGPSLEKARRVYDDLSRRPGRAEQMAEARRLMRAPFLMLGDDRVYALDGAWDRAAGEVSYTEVLARAAAPGPAAHGATGADAAPADAVLAALERGDRVVVLPDRVEVRRGGNLVCAVARRQPWDAFAGRFEDEP